MQISIAPDGRVFFIERDGNLKIYKPDQSVTLLAGHLDVTTNLEGIHFVLKCFFSLTFT
jgi:hypothetical protein